MFAQIDHQQPQQQQLQQQITRQKQYQQQGIFNQRPQELLNFNNNTDYSGMQPQTSNTSGSENAQGTSVSVYRTSRGQSVQTLHPQITMEQARRYGVINNVVTHQVSNLMCVQDPELRRIMNVLHPSFLNPLLDGRNQTPTNGPNQQREMPSIEREEIRRLRFVEPSTELGESKEHRFYHYKSRYCAVVAKLKNETEKFKSPKYDSNDFVANAFQCLKKCRNVLTVGYIFAFFLKPEHQKTLLEDCSSHLESATDELSRMLSSEDFIESEVNEKIS